MTLKTPAGSVVREGHRLRRLTALVANALLLLSCAIAIAADPAPSRPKGGETLLLALKINDIPQDGMLRAVRLREGLAVPQSAWDELHLRLPSGTPRVIDGELHVLMANEGLLRWHIDEASQTLEIAAPASAFGGQQLDLTAGAPRVTQPSAWAPFRNYDAQWKRQRGSRDAAD